MAETKKKTDSSIVVYVQSDARLSINRVLAEVESYNHSGWLLVNWEDAAQDGQPAMKLIFER
jgi:hypothetical protein